MFPSLAGEQTIYDYAQSANYPIGRIIDLADKATSRDVRMLDELATALEAPHPVIRYWGAVGITVLKDQSAHLTSKLLAALEDPYFDVRVAAAEALGYHDQSKAATNALGGVLRTGSPYEQLAALNTLDFMRLAGHVSLPRVQQMTSEIKLAEPADRIRKYFSTLEQ
jgi:HEAT repeat protein